MKRKKDHSNAAAKDMIMHYQFKNILRIATATPVFYMMAALSACNASEGSGGSGSPPNSAPPSFKEQTIKLDIPEKCDPKTDWLGGSCEITNILKDLPSKTPDFGDYPIDSIIDIGSVDIGSGHSVSFLHNDKSMNFIYANQYFENGKISGLILKQKYSKASEVEYYSDIKKEEYRKHTLKNTKSYDCKSDKFNQSICMIKAILEDNPQGGAISEIIRASDTSYMIAIDRYEGVDLYKYEFNLSGTSVQIKSRSIGFREYPPR